MDKFRKVPPFFLKLEIEFLCPEMGQESIHVKQCVTYIPRVWDAR